ncbi:undecaprenyldiphospho-muramoylpentapeptide beta-N-acetylglucosaminyltransferase [Candidatus Hydrogenedentota bacterium]
MRIALCGGGTGGHVTPALAAAASLARIKPDAEFRYFGRWGKIEERLSSSAGIPFKGIAARPWPRSKGGKLTVLCSNAFALLQALMHLAVYRPSVVFCTGGYVSLPLGLAAWLHGIPLVIHEQNSVPGIANRILARLASAAAISFSSAARRLRRVPTHLTGNPVRQELRECQQEREDTVFTIFVFGGSQGAHTLNLGAIELMERLDPTQYRLIVATGEKDLELVTNAASNAPIETEMAAFFECIEKVYSRADLAVCRSGANTLTELAATGLPGILVPYPHATDNHQMKNAEFFANNDAAWIIEEKELTGENLAELVNKAKADPYILESMRAGVLRLDHPDAAREIAQMLIDHAG